MDIRINFSGRAHSYTEDEINTVVSAMKNADPLTQGKYRNEFEQKFAQYIGTAHCFALCNATAGLELAAQICQFEAGDELIIPSHTFTASAYPFVKKGAKLVWADIDLKTKVVTPDTIQSRITDKTKAIVVVHLYGYMADMPEIMRIAEEHNLIVIEDAAQAIGCEINGIKAGAFGDIGIFSLHSHKNITTLGEGGIITIKNKEWAEILPMLRHNGHCDFAFDRENYWLPAMGNVDLPELNGKKLWPNNFCLGEIECALGTKLLDRIDSNNDSKRKRAISFIDELREFPELEFHREDSIRHNYHLLVARITNGKRDEFIRKMHTEKGIKCVIQYYPLNRYDFYKKIGLGIADCPNTDEFYDNMVSFPFQQTLTDTELEYILISTKEILTELRKENEGNLCNNSCN